MQVHAMLSIRPYGADEGKALLTERGTGVS